jgi:hypothetical protein
MPPKAAQLTLHFDAAGLQADLATLGGGEWTAHFNTQYFTGDWSGVALRSAESSPNNIYADANHGEFADTSVLQQCPHLRAVVETFQCPLRSVRLLRLTAGSIIREHRDFDLGYEAGEVRIHVPVITNPSVEFYLDNRRIVMAEGECWYLDLNLPHRVHNLGNTDRVHLVIDCQLNDWLRDLIAQGRPCAGTESGLELFRRHVLSHPELQQQLMGLNGREAFIARNVELGREYGFTFHPTDVEAALMSARRAWMERWIV